MIGDEPANTIKTGAAGDCCVEGRRRVTYRAEVVRGWLLPVCLTVKPVGEPDALIGHVRFDERGWETERRRMAQATAPILDSTISAMRHLVLCVFDIGNWKPNIAPKGNHASITN